MATKLKEIALGAGALAGGLTMVGCSDTAKDDAAHNIRIEQQTTVGERYTDTKGNPRFMVGEASVGRTDDGDFALTIKDIRTDKTKTFTMSYERAKELGLHPSRHPYISAELTDKALTDQSGHGFQWLASYDTALYVQNLFDEAAIKEHAHYHADKPLPLYLEKSEYNIGFQNRLMQENLDKVNKEIAAEERLQQQTLRHDSLKEALKTRGNRLQELTSGKAKEKPDTGHQR